MSSRRDRLIAALAILLIPGACATLLWIVLGLARSGDFAVNGYVLGDNAGPALSALVHGRLAAMASVQPLMGLTSLLWRAPFVAVADALGAGAQLAYAVGALACLLPAAGLVAWLARDAGSVRRLVAVALAAAAIVAGPATLQAAQIGHPEEALATVLATAAVLAAVGGRRGWAAVLLGLAVGTKQWSLLAMPCVLVALPDRRTAVAVRAMLIAGAAALVLPLADPAAFAHADASVGSLHIADPFSVWWGTGSGNGGDPGALAHYLPAGVTRSQAAAVAVVLALGAIWGHGRRVGAGRVPRVDPLALLALVGLVRCVGDPDPLTYNFVAVVIPLAVWEAGSRRRLPLVTALSCGALWLAPTGANAFLAGTGAPLGEPLLSIVWIAAALALGGYLTRCAWRPRGVAAPAAASARRLPVPAA